MEKVFKTVFNSNKTNFSQIKWNKTSSTLDSITIHAGDSKPEEIYYDEVVYYDGGGIDGYGYQK